MTVASNMVEIPRELFYRLLAAIETPDDLEKHEKTILLEDAYQWVPPATDDEINRSFDAYR